MIKNQKKGPLFEKQKGKEKKLRGTLFRYAASPGFEQQKRARRLHDCQTVIKELFTVVSLLFVWVAASVHLFKKEKKTNKRVLILAADKWSLPQSVESATRLSWQTTPEMTLTGRTYTPNVSAPVVPLQFGSVLLMLISFLPFVFCLSPSKQAISP